METAFCYPVRGKAIRDFFSDIAVFFRSEKLRSKLDTSRPDVVIQFRLAAKRLEWKTKNLISKEYSTEYVLHGILQISIAGLRPNSFGRQSYNRMHLQCVCVSLNNLFPILHGTRTQNHFISRSKYWQMFTNSVLLPVGSITFDSASTFTIINSRYLQFLIQNICVLT